jgi:ribonuclease T2
MTPRPGNSPARRAAATGLLVLLAAAACQRPLTAQRPATAEPARPAVPSPAAAQQGSPAATFGLYVLALTWPPSFCCTHSKKGQCNNLATSFGATHLTLHGLWPNYTDAEAEGQSRTYPTYFGTYSGCNSRQPDKSCLPAVESIPADLATYGPGYVTDNNFLANHEWPKHGSCTGLDSGSYFRAAVAQLKSLPGDQGTPALLTKGVGATVRLTELQAAFGDPSAVLLSCDSGCRLEQVGICFAHDEKNRPTSQIPCPKNTRVAPYTNSCVLNKCDTISVQAAGQCSLGPSPPRGAP